MRIKKRTQEKRFDDRGQMDDDHQKKCDGDNVVTVIIETPKQSFVDDEDTSRRRCHYDQPIKAIHIEKKIKKAYKGDTTYDKVQTRVCIVVVTIDGNDCMGVHCRALLCITMVGRFFSKMRLWKCGR